MDTSNIWIPNPEAPWVQAFNGTKVKVHSVGYVNADLSDGNLGIYVYAMKKKVPVWGKPFNLVLPGSIDTWGTRPDFKIDMAGGNFDPKTGRGPFTIQMEDAYVDGMGLPLNRHVIYVVQFAIVP